MKHLASTISILLLFAAAAFASNIGIFPGEAGIEIGAGTPVGAKIRARNQALKEAVEKAVIQAVNADLYQKHKAVIERKILAKAGYYVQSYDIITSEMVEGFYKIQLEARVDLDRLSKDVKALATFKDDGPKIKGRLLLVTTVRQMEEETFWQPLYDALGSRFEVISLAPLSADASKSYLETLAFQRYTEKSLEETFDQGPILDVRYALVFRTLIADQNALCPNIGTAIFLDLSNRKVLAKIPYNFQEGIGCEQAAEIGAKTVFALLSEKLTGYGIFDQAVSAATRLTITGLRGYRDTTMLTSLIRGIPDIKSIAMHSFSTGGRVTFRITYEGDRESLIKALLRLKATGFSLSRQIGKDESELLFEAEY